MPLWIVLVYAVVLAFGIFGAVRLIQANKPAYAKAVLVTYVFYTTVFALVWILKIVVPPYLLLLTMLTVWGSCFLGHYRQLYNTSKVFDRYLHAFGTFSFALFTYCVLDDFLQTGGSQIYQALFVTLLGNTLGVIFELTEMLHDLKKQNEPRCQKGLLDTDMDQLFNLGGSILAGLFAYLWILQ